MKTKIELLEEIADLKELNNDLAMQVDELEEENTRLREMLNVQTRAQEKTRSLEPRRLLEPLEEIAGLTREIERLRLELGRK